MFREKITYGILLVIAFSITVLVYFNNFQPIEINTKEVEVTYIKTGVYHQYNLAQGLKLDSKEKEVEKANACFVVLVRNKEINEWRKTMQQLEDRFNKKFNYPYVFLNDKPFSTEFIQFTKALTNATTEFGIIPKEHWSIPQFIDTDKAKSSWKKMEQDNIIYGGSESYRHMCRYESGFFFRHNLTLQYDYYWRVEPGVSFHCDIDQDPFLFMQKNNKLYGFTIALYEFQSTIETLWSTVKLWVNLNRKNLNLPKDNALSFISDDGGKNYNLCHFWSNFEIASFKLWRDPQYLNFFNFLDRSGGFFYERWGDAPVHSIYAALTLKLEQFHFFDNIGYTHPPNTHCPTGVEQQKKCHCDPNYSFDNVGYSCAPKWFKLMEKK